MTEPSGIPRGTTPLHRALAAALREIAEREALERARRRRTITVVPAKEDQAA